MFLLCLFHLFPLFLLQFDCFFSEASLYIAFALVKHLENSIKHLLLVRICLCENTGSLQSGVCERRAGGVFVYSLVVHTESVTYRLYKLNYCFLCILLIPCFQHIYFFFNLSFLNSHFCLDTGPRQQNTGRQVLLQSWLGLSPEKNYSTESLLTVSSLFPVRL